MAPLTGGIAHLGKDNENGARMAVEEINAAGGLKVGDKTYKLDLVAEDDKADPKEGTIAAQKIVDSGAVAVVGHLNSGTSIPASKIYADASVTQISPSATNPKLTRSRASRRPSASSPTTTSRAACSRTTRLTS